MKDLTLSDAPRLITSWKYRLLALQNSKESGRQVPASRDTGKNKFEVLHQFQPFFKLYFCLNDVTTIETRHFCDINVSCVFPWLCHFFFGVASQNQTKNDHLVVVLEDRVKIFNFHIFQFCQKQTFWVLKFLGWCFNDIWCIFKWIWVIIPINSYLESTFQYLIVEILATLGRETERPYFLEISRKSW